MSLLRAFIAIELSADIRQAISTQSAVMQARLKGCVRWVPASNIHLTLKFLGDVAPSNVEMLKQSLQAEASQHPVFDLSVSGLGAFPNARHARVIWVGIQAPATLNRIQHAIESACARLGYPAEERPFSPHLTIGRIREQVSTSESQAIRTVLETTRVGELGAMRVETVHLFKSDLQPSGAIYTSLHSAPLTTIP